MARVIEFANNGKSVEFCRMPDDALRHAGAGPLAEDVVSYRPGVMLKGVPHVCVKLARPCHVRVGYVARGERCIRLSFINPAFPPEDYVSGELKVIGAVEEFFERRLALPRGRTPLAPLPDEGMLFETDAGGNIVELDDALIERCWGVEARECYGYGFINQVAPELRARFSLQWAEAVLRGGAVLIRTAAERVDGERVPLMVAATPAKGRRGYSGVTRPGQIMRVA